MNYFWTSLMGKIIGLPGRHQGKVTREVLGRFFTPNKNLLEYDDKDGRKFMREMLYRLDDRRRLSFVRWCSQQRGKFNKFAEPLRVVALWSERDKVVYPVDEALSDLAMLTVGSSGEGGLDADVILTELYRRVRKA